MIKQLFWKAFYKIHLGKNYSSAIKSAGSTWATTKQTSKGNLSLFYNINGEQIRGWHKPIASQKKKVSNDPMQRYINDFK